MNLDLFRAELTELAEDVRSVDLRDRVHATSRRIGRRRALVAVTAVAAAVVAAGGVALAAAPGNNAAPVLPPADTPSPTLVVPTPSSEPSNEPSTPPTSDPSDGPKSPVVEWGTLFYGPVGPSDEETGHLFAWSGRGAPERLIELPRNEFELNATVSPDGRRIAWVDRDARLYVANLDGSGKRKLLDGVEGQCWGPYWTADSSKLGAQRGTSTKGVYDLERGRWTELKSVSGCHPLYSSDGSTIAYSDASRGRLMTADESLRRERAVPGIGGTGADRIVFDVTSVSPDGRYVALWAFGPDAESHGDVGRGLRVNAIVDVTDGTEVDLPLGGREMRQAYFRPDGSLIVRTADSRLILFSADREKVAEIAEPAALRNLQVISVAG